MTMRKSLTVAALVLSAAVASAQGNKPAPAPVVNVNTATAAELMLLPGIGPKLAGEIYRVAEAGFYLYDPTYYSAEKGWLKTPPNGCDHRCHFKSVDDLLKVKGIGRAKLEALRPFVTVTGPTTAKAKIRVAKAAK